MLPAALDFVASPLFWLSLAVLIWPVLWVSVLLHEAGHALAGRWAGYHVAAWGLGDGEPLLLIPPAPRPAHTRFFLCRRHWLNGCTGAYFPGLLPTRAQAAAFILGGPAVNFLLSLAGFLILRSEGAWLPVGLTVAGVNALLGLMALAPRRPQGLPTDGARLAALLLARSTQLLATSPRTYLAQNTLWNAVHAPTLRTASLLAAAAAAAELGDADTAQQYLNESEALRGNPNSPLMEQALLILGLRREASEQARFAERAFRQAQSHYERAGRQAATLMVAIYRADVNGEKLDALYREAAATPFPALRTLAAYRALLAAGAGGTSATLATALSRYQTARITWRSDVQDARAFTVAAQAIERWGDTAGASALREQAQTAMERIAAALADDPETLTAFQQRLTQAV